MSTWRCTLRASDVWEGADEEVMRRTTIFSALSEYISSTGVCSISCCARTLRATRLAKLQLHKKRGGGVLEPQHAP